MKRQSIASTVLCATLALSCKDDAAKPDGGAGPVDASMGVDGGGVVLDDAGVPVDGSVVTRQNVLEATAACASATYRDFVVKATALDSATAALAATPTPDTIAAARDAFRAAMTSWQVAEVMQFGPAGLPPDQPGGLGLRDEIYAWPADNRCAVEEQIVSRGYESAGFANALFQRRGLAALEYLLFYEGSDTACPPSSTIVSSGSWAALSADDRAARKRAYAARAAADLRTRATTLANAWAPAQGNFEGALATAGRGSTVYTSTQTALNAVGQALFYIETEVREMKVAEPAQLRDCVTMPCRTTVESPYAQLSKTNLAANLAGFRRITEGCSADYHGVGFDDLLTSLGASDLASRMVQAAANAEAAVAAIPQPDLASAIRDNRPAVVALYEALRTLKGLFETELVTVLNLEKPDTDPTDND